MWRRCSPLASARHWGRKPAWKHKKSLAQGNRRARPLRRCRPRMWAYSYAAFRVTTLSAGRFAPEPGTLAVATHSEMDVPPRPAALLRDGRPAQPHGPPPLRRPRRHVPAGILRRLLASTSPRALAGSSIPSGSSAPARQRLSDPQRERGAPRRGLRRRPDDPLDELVPEETAVDVFRARAGFCRRGRRRRVPVTLCTAPTPTSSGRPSRPGGRTGDLDDFWSCRAARAAGDFRHLVGLLRDGGCSWSSPAWAGRRRTASSARPGRGSGRLSGAGVPRPCVRSPSPTTHSCAGGRASISPSESPLPRRQATWRGRDPRTPQALDAADHRPVRRLAARGGRRGRSDRARARPGGRGRARPGRGAASRAGPRTPEGRRRRLAEALAAAPRRSGEFRFSRARARERPRAPLAVLLRGSLASAAQAWEGQAGRGWRP